MGSFHVQLRIENRARRTQRAMLVKVLVDTDSEYTWIPAATLEQLGSKREKDLAFLTANGQTITRSLGFAIVHVAGTFTVDEVVFGEAGDQQILGARGLTGLNLTVDPARKRLVVAGPLPAA